MDGSVLAEQSAVLTCDVVGAGMSTYEEVLEDVRNADLYILTQDDTED